MCLSGTIELEMAMRGNIKSDQTNSVGLLHEVQPNPLGSDLSNSMDCVQEHQLCFLTSHACMHAHIHGCSSDRGVWLFHKRTQNINVVTKTKPLA